MRGAGCALTFFDHWCQHVATEFSLCFSVWFVNCTNLKVQWEGFPLRRTKKNKQKSFINQGDVAIM